MLHVGDAPRPPSPPTPPPSTRPHPILCRHLSLPRPCVRVQAEGKGKGVFVVSPIRKGDLVLEYVGEVINKDEYDRRMSEEYRVRVALCLPRQPTVHPDCGPHTVAGLKP